MDFWFCNRQQIIGMSISSLKEQNFIGSLDVRFQLTSAYHSTFFPILNISTPGVFILSHDWAADPAQLSGSSFLRFRRVERRHYRLVEHGCNSNKFR